MPKKTDDQFRQWLQDNALSGVDPTFFEGPKASAARTKRKLKSMRSKGHQGSCLCHQCRACRGYLLMKGIVP